MPHWLRVTFGFLMAGFIVAAPLKYAFYMQSQIKNFHAVHESVLYRSGQMSLAGLKDIVQDYGINTVITLRDAKHPGDTPPDQDEEDYCRSQGLHYYRLAPPAWLASDGSVPADEAVKQFLGVMDRPENYPVLIHCFAGIHRTGAFCAIFRMEYEHWTNDAALDELFACGYTNLYDEWDILTYLQNYHPRWQIHTPLAANPSAPVEAQPVKWNKDRP